MATNNALDAPFPLSGADGGTGVNNGAFTITLGGNLTTAGSNSLTLTTTGTTNVTLPTSGTIALVTDIIPNNFCIGGNFDTNPWQLGTSFSAVANNQVTADLWSWQTAGTGVVTIAQVANAPTVSQAGLFVQNSLQVSVTTAKTSPTSTDIYRIKTNLEGYDWTQLAQREFTISFWVYATVAGIYTIAFDNSSNDHSIVFEYTVATTLTWQQVIINVPASPSAGTWNYTNGIGLNVYFNVAMGSSFNGTAGVWTSSGPYSTSNQVNGMSSTSNVFAIDLIQIEQGAVAHPFVMRQVQEELALCQRWAEKSYSPGVNPGTNTNLGQVAYSNSAATTGTFIYSVPFKVTKRNTTPTVTIYSTAGTSGKVTEVSGTEISATVQNVGDYGFQVTGTNGSSVYGALFHYVTS